MEQVIGGARIVSSWRTDQDEAEDKDQQRHNSKTPSFPPTHLVLHFDINETILVGDECGGDSREDCLNKMIAKSAFCRLPPNFFDLQGLDTDIPHERYQSAYPTHWWDGTPIANHHDHQVGDSAQEHQQQLHIPPLYTGWDWPTGTCPYYRTSLKPRAKEFIHTDGIMYQDLYQTLDCKLGNATNTTKASPSASSAAVLPRYQEMMKSMIPAFFETLVELSRKQRRRLDSSTGGDRVTVVIRTFGMDLPDVAMAVSDFAQGHHPNYPDFMDPGLVLSGQHLYQGRWAPTTTTCAERTNGNSIKAVYQLWQHGKVVADGDEQVLALLHSCTICGIQDDYYFWRENNYQPWAGKPVWAMTMPPNHHDKKDQQAKQQRVYHHHILLDDNIHNLHDDSVACVREEQDGPPVTFRTMTGKEIQAQHGLHSIRVPTIEPVLNPHWFLEQIGKAQRKLMQKFKTHCDKDDDDDDAEVAI